MSSKAAFLSALLATSLASSIALAADPPPLPAPPTAPASADPTTTTSTTATVDAVHLRNGGLYRGHVSEIVPGDYVTIVVEKGDTKRIPWAEIDRVIVASTPMPPPPTGTSPSAPSAPPPMAGPLVRVRVKSSRSVILYRKPAGTNSWSQACLSPCNIELPLGDSYRIAGNGVQQSREFRIEASPGSNVELTVDPPSTGGMVLGGLLAGVGATGAYTGLLMSLVGIAQINDRCFGDSGNRYCSDKKIDAESLRDAGLITLGVGSVLTVVGLIVFLNSATTDIAQSASGKSDGANRRPLDAFLREPTWKNAKSSSETAMGSPATAFPLVLTTTF